MFKKILLIFLILISAILLCSNSISRSYSIRCYKCENYAKEHHYERSCSGCPTWRMFELETKNNPYLVYRCAHGHTLYVDPKTNEKK